MLAHAHAHTHHAHTYIHSLVHRFLRPIKPCHTWHSKSRAPSLRGLRGKHGSTPFLQCSKGKWSWRKKPQPAVIWPPNRSIGSRQCVHLDFVLVWTKINWEEIRRRCGHLIWIQDVEGGFKNKLFQPAHECMLGTSVCWLRMLVAPLPYETMAIRMYAVRVAARRKNGRTLLSVQTALFHTAGKTWNVTYRCFERHYNLWIYYMLTSTNFNVVVPHDVK